MQKALVTGANGFVGSALVRRLLRDGVQVRAMCRDPKRGAHLAKDGAEIVAGDVQDESSVERLARGCDVVFHVAAVAWGGALHQYAVNVSGSENTIRAAYQAKVDRFVHVSTVATYGHTISGTITEDTPLRPPRDDFYAQSKAEGENRIMRFARQTGLPTAAVRPAFIYGPGSSFWSRKLYDACAKFAMPLVDQGRGHAHPIFIEDLVDLTVTLATHPNAPGNIFNAAPDPAPTWGEFLGHYARMSGNAKSFTLPVGLIKSLAQPVAHLSRLAGQPFNLAGYLDYWGHRATFSMARARSLLGWAPRYSLEQGMALTEPWLKGLSN